MSRSYLSAGRKKPISSHPLICQVPLPGTFTFNRTSTVLFIFPFRLLHSSYGPPHTFRLSLQLMRVWGEVDLFPQPASGSWPYLFYSPFATTYLCKSRFPPLPTWKPNTGQCPSTSVTFLTITSTSHSDCPAVQKWGRSQSLNCLLWTISVNFNVNSWVQHY